MCFEINTFLITSKEKFTKLLFRLFCFMGVRFGEVWRLREDLFNRLRSFHKRCIHSMCHVSLCQAFHHHISSATLFQKLTVMDLDSYYHNWILRWAGHVARMPMTRAPRQFLTGWVADSRPNGPNGCPEMTWSRT